MLLLQNVRTVRLNPPEIVPNQDIVIEGDHIIEVGPNLSSLYPTAEIMTFNGHLVTPGLVCAHNHFYSVLARGILAPIKESPDFVSILKNLWWRLDQAIDEEILQASATIAALESIKCGTTSVIDHHASPNCLTGSLTIIRDAFENMGLRGILCYEVSDRYGDEKTKESIDENLSFTELCKIRSDSDLVKAAIGAHAPFTLSDKTLLQLAEVVSATKRGLHIHVAEDKHDVSDSIQRFGKEPLERLEKFKLLDDKTICVHGVHLSNTDINRLNYYNSFLIHNPRSNMNNNVGYMKRLSNLNNVALGTDGIGSDMFEEMKIGYFKNKDSSGSLTPRDFLGCLNNGNMILERYFDRPFGRIEKGFTADITIIDYQSPTPLVAENLAGHFIFGLSSSCVHTVIINGRLVYRNKQFPFSVEPLYNRAQQSAYKLWRKLED